MTSMLPVTVRIMFGQTIVDSRMEEVKIEIAADGSDTVQQVKERIAVRARVRPHTFLHGKTFTGRQAPKVVHPT